MTEPTLPILEAELLDESLRLSLHEVCDALGAEADYVIELVAEGVIETGSGDDPASWHFDGLAITRIQRAQRLGEDLGINLAGIALVLDLLDEVERLRRPG